MKILVLVVSIVLFFVGIGLSEGLSPIERGDAPYLKWWFDQQDGSLMLFTMIAFASAIIALLLSIRMMLVDPVVDGFARSKEKRDLNRRLDIEEEVRRDRERGRHR